MSNAKKSNPLKIQRQNDYFNTTGDWELTWPIWHMLSRDERKAIAIQHGMKTIGEFEEYMSLHKAEELSSTPIVTTVVPPYSNELAAATLEEEHELDDDDDEEEEEEELTSRLSSAVTISDDDEYDEMNDSKLKASSSDQPFKDEDIIKYGGILLTTLPEELLHKILTFLEIDYYHYLSNLNPIWESCLLHHNTNKHNTFQILCKRIYLQQSKRKALHPSNFQNSFKIMYHTRPRIKTGCGLYIFKYSEVKRIERDMWTEVPVGAILEMIYYRYLYFLEGGVVLYALTASPPMEVLPKLRYIRTMGNIINTKKRKTTTLALVDPNNTQHLHDLYKKYNIEWGRYEVSKYNVDVHIQHPWCFVLLQLSILRGVQVGYDGIQGQFRVLKLENHLTSSNGEWRGNDVAHLCTPTGYFRFLTDWTL